MQVSPGKCPALNKTQVSASGPLGSLVLKLGKMSQNVLSAAVVIGALRIKNIVFLSGLMIVPTKHCKTR